MKTGLSIIILLFCTALPAIAADEGASQNNNRAKQALKRFPKADINGDGILTRKEFREFRCHKHNVH